MSPDLDVRAGERWPPPPPEEERGPVRMDPAADYDVLGRKQPQRLGFMVYARAIPGYAAVFARRVPDQFVATVGQGVVDVSCPCGVTPAPRCDLFVPRKCDGCNRYYVLVGTGVRVGYDPE